MLENIFSSKVGTKILLHVGQKPYHEFYLNQLSRKLNIGLGRTQTLLNNLAEEGVLSKTKSGNRILYKLNENNPLTFEVIRLAHMNALLDLPKKYRTTLSELQRRMEGMLKENLTTLVVYGSVSKAKARPESDIDIFILTKKTVGKETLKKIRDEFFEVSDIFLQHPEEKIMSEKKFKENYDLGDDFLINVMQDGIIVCDKNNYYARFLLKGNPNVTRKSIEKRIEVAKRWLDQSIALYKKHPESLTSILGVASIHLARAMLLLNHVQPGSRHETPKQLAGVGEKEFAKTYRKTRAWEDNPPLEVDKEEVWRYLSFLKEKYDECVRRLQSWT